MMKSYLVELSFKISNQSMNQKGHKTAKNCQQVPKKTYQKDLTPLKYAF